MFPIDVVRDIRALQKKLAVAEQTVDALDGLVKRVFCCTSLTGKELLESIEAVKAKAKRDAAADTFNPSGHGGPRSGPTVDPVVGSPNQEG